MGINQCVLLPVLKSLQIAPLFHRRWTNVEVSTQQNLKKRLLQQAQVIIIQNNLLPKYGVLISTVRENSFFAIDTLFCKQ